MATLANIFNRFSVASAAVGALESGVRTHVDESSRLRALPNESIYFYVKPINNARVVKQADPVQRARDRRVVAGGFAAAVLLIAALLPSAYGLIASYELNQLRAEHQRLVNERSTLDLEEARLTSPEELEKLARRQNFEPPTPDRVVYIGPKNDAALALNRQ